MRETLTAKVARLEGARMSPPNVAGLAETATLLGISKERVRQLRAGGKLPDPRELECGPVWDRGELLAMRADRTQDARRVAGKHALCLKVWRETHNVSAAARACEISRGTVRRWLETMEETT